MDWIKMRTDLYTDPKVIVMADFILEGDGDLARSVHQCCQRDTTVTSNVTGNVTGNVMRNVMRNVTRNAVVGALVSVWGVSRRRGKRVGDDILIESATINVIDDVGNMPGLGEAMEGVGWAKGTDDGVVFPCFFETYNIDPREEVAAKNRERQKRFRQNRPRNDSNVTVTLQSNAREEKRREEDIKETKAKKDRFTPPTPQQATDYAKSIEFDLDGEQFVDHYTSKGWMIGKNPMKDWRAAVRTWKRQRAASTPAPQPKEEPRAPLVTIRDLVERAGLTWDDYLLSKIQTPGEVVSKIRWHKDWGDDKSVLEKSIQFATKMGWCKEDAWETTQ